MGDAEPTAVRALRSLRPYQVAAVEAVMMQLADIGGAQGTLLLLATGLGKTVVAAEIIQCWLVLHPRERVLFLAHRDELINQACAKIEDWTGRVPDREKAEAYDRRESAILVASTQTLLSPLRLARHDSGEFSLIVCDEVHHYHDGGTWARILDHFLAAKRLGLTATATRADGKKLGEDWDSIAYEYELAQAISDGWLAPITRKRIVVSSLSLDGVETRQGDLVAGQVEERVLKDEATVHAWARGILDAAPGRKVLAFCPGVASSRQLCEILNRYSEAEGKQTIAVHVDGETPINERRMLLHRFSVGDVRILCNCGIALEGYDEPAISCVAMCRPTKSEVLYVQAVGRGTRGGPNCPVPGKADLLVIDFTDNSERMDLVTAVDVLCDDEDEKMRAIVEQATRNGALVGEEIERAKQARKEAEERRKAEEEARAASEAQRAHVRATAKTLTFDVDKIERDPDKILGVNRFAAAYHGRKWGGKPLTEKQTAWLQRSGFEIVGTADGLAIARARLAALGKRASKQLCTIKQARLLARYGIPANVSMNVARRAIDAIAGAGWRPSPDQLAKIRFAVETNTSRDREPGEEG